MTNLIGTPVRPWEPAVHEVPRAVGVFLAYGGSALGMLGFVWSGSTQPVFAHPVERTSMTRPSPRSPRLAVPSRATQPSLPKPALAAASGHFPLSFEPNQGQTDQAVKFLARGPGYTIFLSQTEAVLALQKTEANGAEVKGQDSSVNPSPITQHPSRAQAVLRTRLEGANANATIAGLEPLPGIVNYLIGNDPAKWRPNIPSYKKVEYKGVYPGIDLVYYGDDQRQLEYDLVVAPGADPSRIRLALEGATTIDVDVNGDLLLTLPDGPPQSNVSSRITPHASPITRSAMLRLQKPNIYQLDGKGHKDLIAGNYVLRSEQPVARSEQLPASQSGRSAANGKQFVFGIQLATYDTTKPLIIDPVLSYSTYLGGTEYDEALDGAVDMAGNVYVTGRSSSVAFPGTGGSPIQGVRGVPSDAFVTKLNATGTAIAYSTYLGGSGVDEGRGIAVDSAGSAHVVGFTSSTSFPGTAGSRIQNILGGGTDSFVTKLNSQGTAIVYSTYLGGSGFETAQDIALDAAGNAYLTGWTDSGSGTTAPFPGTSGSAIQPVFGGGRFDAFVTKLNASGTAIVYSTYLGGSGEDRGGEGIAVDAAGNVYVTGKTDSGSGTTTPFPGTSGSPIQATFGGGSLDAFVTKIDAAATALVYSTYLGGSGADIGFSIALDGAGNAYVTGGTTSTGFPGTTSSGIQNTPASINDAFVTKLNVAGTAIMYSTYLGGMGFDEAYGIAVDRAGNAYVTGRTASADFPGTAASQIQSTLGDVGAGGDAFVTTLNPAGSAILYSTYLGGNGFDFPFSIALDAAAGLYVIGRTNSTNFQGAAGSPIQGVFAGNEDAFVAKIEAGTPSCATKAVAYVAEISTGPGIGQLSAVDLVTGAKTYIAAGSPSGIAINPQESRAYVTASGILFAFGLAPDVFGELERQYSPLGTFAADVALDPGGTAAYVTTPGSVFRFDLATGTTEIIVTSRSNLREIVVNAQGTAAYVAEARTGTGTGRLLKVDLATKAVTVLAAGLTAPSGVAVNSAETLVYFSDTNALRSVDLTSPSAPTAVLSGVSLFSLALDSGENVLFATTTAGGLLRIDLTDRSFTTVTTGLGNPRGIALACTPPASASIADADGDGLRDSWEAAGIDFDGDGLMDLDLPALGANPLHKDIFIEIDHMELHTPNAEGMADLVAAFANASTVENPDGETGIRLHVDVDEQLAHLDCLEIWSGFDAIKGGSFGTVAQRADVNAANVVAAKRLAYHYALFIHHQCNSGFMTTATGIGELPGDDVVISLGNSDASHFNPAQGRGQHSHLFMHEFGHNLGLLHGGGDGVNCKPNYLSVMSYSYLGVKPPNHPLDYSREEIPALDEAHLDERVGVQSASGITTVYGPEPLRFTPTGVPVDWNRDGDATDADVGADINHVMSTCFSSGLEPLTGFDDWRNLKYNFRRSVWFGLAVHPDPSDMPPEITLEDFRQMRQLTLQSLNDEIQRLSAEVFSNPHGAPQRKRALRKKILDGRHSVAALVAAADFSTAIEKLRKYVRARMDGSAGGKPQNDWIVDPDAQARLLPIIDNIIGTLEVAFP